MLTKGKKFIFKALGNAIEPGATAAAAAAAPAEAERTTHRLDQRE